MKKYLVFILLSLSTLYTSAFATPYNATNRNDVQAYIHQLVKKHHFEEDRLEQLFNTVTMDDEVIARVSKPAEAKPWYLYRELFITPDRINKGVAYFKEHEQTLARAEKLYGVPASIIVAIIGVETKYGANKGTFPVFNTLVTLAFNDGRRADFFKSELTEYLLLARENNFKPLLLKGSYAGAVGLPQFMPSSYRHYAVDFTNKGFVDLFENHADAIGSIGNYLNKHGWKKDAEIVIPASVAGDSYTQIVQKNFKPHLSVSDLERYNIMPTSSLHGNKTALIRLEEKNGNSYWLGLQNFYVISTYNKSELYVMAVYELAQSIEEAKSGQTRSHVSAIESSEQKPGDIEEPMSAI
jgi:membrane-bound lytic murein transglycosylase B